jgi:intracellular sulfur oxidation DsrE/DsrF family protein
MTTPSPDHAPSRDRRSFLTRLAGLGAALGLATPRLAEASTALDGMRVGDDPWVAKLIGKHRVVFHSHMPTDGLAIRWAQTFLDTQKSTYGFTDRDSSVVVGLNGRSIGWLFNDALWARYPTIGEVMGAPGSKNPQTALVGSLIPRGVIVLACHNSLRASGSRFLPVAQQGDASARTAFAEEARANLLAGVEVVPAMIVTLQQAQDRGCRYIYAGG